jgi:hypothetical protein
MTQPQLIIDGSHTLGSGKNTGIERVVRNLCREMRVATVERGLPSLQVVTHFQKRFLPLDERLEWHLSRLAAWESNAGGFVPSWVNGFPSG